jgi:hypothetical protein
MPKNVEIDADIKNENNTKKYEKGIYYCSAGAAIAVSAFRFR